MVRSLQDIVQRIHLEIYTRVLLVRKKPILGLCLNLIVEISNNLKIIFHCLYDVKNNSYVFKITNLPEFQIGISKITKPVVIASNLQYLERINFFLHKVNRLLFALVILIIFFLLIKNLFSKDNNKN